jgi:transcription initiation factor TFIIH subunit 1
MVRFVGPKNASFIFQFPNEKERDNVSDNVAQLLARLKAKEKAASEAAAGSGKTFVKSSPVEVAARKALLASNKELQALYNEMVVAGVVSDEDFWAARRQLLEAATAKAGAGQRLGISNAMMATVKPTSDGRSNTVKFNLTPEMMHQIFAEKPAVRKAYLTNVPEIMNERTFWTRYCRAQYFQKVRKGACAQGEEEAEDIALFEDNGASEALAAKRLKTIDPTVPFFTLFPPKWQPQPRMLDAKTHSIHSPHVNHNREHSVNTHWTFRAHSGNRQ